MLRSKQVLCPLLLLLGLGLITPVHGTPSLSLDGAGSNSCFGFGPISCSVAPFGTSNPNDVIIVFATSPTTSVSFITPTDSQGHLSFALRKTFTASVTDSEWWGIATSALSGDTITVTTTGTAGFGMVVWGISGANTASPFDPSSGVPATNSGTPSTCVVSSCSVTVAVSVSTSNGNDMILGLGGNTVSNAFGAGSGFTFIAISSVAGAEFQVVSSAQSGLSVQMQLNYPVDTAPPWVMIGDAVQALTTPPIPEYPIGLSILSMLLIQAYAVIKRRTIIKKRTFIFSLG